MQKFFRWLPLVLVVATVFAKIYVYNACVQASYTCQRLQRQLTTLAEQRATILADYARVTAHEQARALAHAQGMVPLTSRHVVDIRADLRAKAREQSRG